MRKHLDVSAKSAPVPSGKAPAAGPMLTVATVELRNPDDLREATRGADLNVVQLIPGGFKGRLTHAQIGGLSLSAGDFEPAIRARGVMNAELVTIGMMVESSGEVLQWDYDVEPGDIVLFPKAVEQEGRFTGRSRYLTLTLSEADLAAHAACERSLQDPGFWTEICRFRPSPVVRSFIRGELAQKIARLREGNLPASASAIGYLKRSLIEAFLVGILDAQANEARDHDHRNGSKLVKGAEDYVDAIRPDRPIHISELCAALSVSRRTLHRSFHEALGVGPAEYLRLRRLAAVHKMLSFTPSAPLSVTQAALENGFSDLGRFAAYYRRHYGETPSQTYRRAAGSD